MSHSGCALVRHFQPRVTGSSYSDVGFTSVHHLYTVVFVLISDLWLWALPRGFESYGTRVCLWAVATFCAWIREDLSARLRYFSRSLQSTVRQWRTTVLRYYTTSAGRMVNRPWRGKCQAAVGNRRALSNGAIIGYRARPGTRPAKSKEQCTLRTKRPKRSLRVRSFALAKATGGQR